jgi:hypothetical protein
MESSQEETIGVRYDETGYEFYIYPVGRPLIYHDINSYAPGDGFIYFIISAQGKSTIRRLGLEHMSDAWKVHTLAHFEVKRPARKPRYRGCPEFQHKSNRGGGV